MKLRSVFSSSKIQQFARPVGIILLTTIASTAIAQTPSREPEVGFEFEGSQTLNSTTIVSKEYIGERAWF